MNPVTPAPDDKDWTWVLDKPCPECGFDAASVGRTEVGARARASAAALQTALAAPDAAQRPEPEVWSALEYGAHVRDVCIIFGARLSLMRGVLNPEFANWDQDETALAEQYWTQDPETVSAELGSEVERIAADFDSVGDDEWERPGRRSNGSMFTVDTLGRYFLHDLHHHVHDVS
jgi:hypothetical protein